MKRRSLFAVLYASWWLILGSNCAEQSAPPNGTLGAPCINGQCLGNLRCATNNVCVLATDDAAISDAAISDAAISDAAVSDATVSDAAISDAAISDAAISDAGPALDAAATDGGLIAPPSSFAHLSHYYLKDLRDLWAAASDDVWAVGIAGALLHYNGTSWEPAKIPSSLPTPTHFYAVWGLDAKQVWAVGSAGALIAYDGSSWKAINQTASTGNFSDIHGTAANDLWIAASDGTLHFDGVNWKIVDQFGYMRLVHAFSKNHVLAVPAFSASARRYDGVDWKTVSGVNSIDVRALHPTAPDAAVLVGRQGLATHYVNGTFSALPSAGSDMSAVWAKDINTIVACGATKAVSYDGSKWTPMVLPPRVACGALASTGSNRLWATAWDSDSGTGFGALLRFDGSQWVTHTSGGHEQSYGKILADGADSAWAFGNDVGAAMRCEGFGCETRLLTNRQQIDDAVIVAPSDGWAVGRYIYRYDGTAWKYAEAVSNGRLFGVWGKDPKTLWAVGKTNGGQAMLMERPAGSWVTPTNLPQIAGELRSVWGADDKHVWAVGTVAMFYDGSKWSVISLPSVGAMWSVHGSSASDVWVGASASQVLHYDGSQWTTTTTPANGAAVHVVYRHGGQTYAAADDSIYRYDGKVWTKLDLPPATYTSISAHGSSFWFCDARGAILRSQ